VMLAASESQVILITGTSSGIGRLAAETLARAGHVVYASMRDPDGKDSGTAKILEQSAAHVIQMDVTQSDSVDRAVDSVIQDAGRLDVLVNNAGHMSIGIAEGFTEAQAYLQMDVNFFGPVRTSRAVLPHMRQRGSGLIVHVSSIVGRVLFPACAFYCASKFALEAYAEILHYELTGLGIESIIVEPGPFPTQLLANSPGPADQSRVDAYGGIAQIREVFTDSFSKFFASEQSPKPQDVADAIAKLVGTPAGERPLRTVCGPDYGAIAINEHTAPIQAEVLRALGRPEMANRAHSVAGQ